MPEMKNYDVIILSTGPAGLQAAIHAARKKVSVLVPGVFAAGDICGPPWQMAKAVGEGCVVGLSAAGYAKRLKRSE